MRASFQAGHLIFFAAALMAGLSVSVASAANIFTCVDASGQRFTADRPIAQCSDREQRILDASGIERKKLGPSLTDAQRNKQSQEQRDNEQKAYRAKEQKRRLEKLLVRFPSSSHHAAARQAQLMQVEALKRKVEFGIAQLDKDNRLLQQEWEGYRAQQKPIPGRLQFALQDGMRELDDKNAQLRLHSAELARINQLFDVEYKQLRPLWSERSRLRQDVK